MFRRFRNIWCFVVLVEYDDRGVFHHIDVEEL